MAIGDWHRKRLGFTTVVFHRDVQGVVAYFTLANDALPLTTAEQLELDVDIPLSAYPAVKLGRLAVSAALQGQGIGEQVMGFVHGEVLESSSLSAARLVILDADNDERVIASMRTALSSLSSLVMVEFEAEVRSQSSAGLIRGRGL